MRQMRNGLAAGIAAAAVVWMGGCPLGTSGLPAVEYVAGNPPAQAQVGTTASVRVFSPVSDLAITGGTPVEANWQAIATTRNAVVDVFFDLDTEPDNGNEIVSENNLALGTSTATLDTTRLDAGDYFVGVRIEQIGQIVASGYAPGRLTINQRPRLFFTSPRDNFRFDRTERLTPHFDVAWQLDDPDSIVTVQIFLDPDATPNGNEILLRESNSQTGDSFSFDLPTASFNSGTYRILAIVSDGVDTFPFYAPASVKLRSRYAGYIDLRDLALPTSTVPGVVFEGFNPRDNAGSFVASATDIDRDGFADFLIVAQFGKPQYAFNLQRTGIGEAYLIYGRASRFSGVINLNSTGTLFRGEIYAGVPEVSDPIRPSRGITSFEVLSDWDGDTIREFAFGLPFTDSLSIDVFQSSLAAFRTAPLDENGYFRTGGVVVASSSSLRPDLGFPGRNVMNLAEFGTLVHTPFTCLRCVDPSPCPCLEGFYGPHAPSAPCPDTKFNRHWPITVAGVANSGSVRQGCRFASNDFGDQFGEVVSRWDFDSIIMTCPNRDPFASSLRVTNNIPGGGVISVFYCDVKDGFFPWSGVNAPPANAARNYPGLPNGQSAALPHGGPFHYVVDDIRAFASVVGPLLGSPGYWVDPDDSPPCTITIDGHIATPDNSVRFWSSTVGARLSNARGVDDVNADGLQDLLIGAPQANDGAGTCFIVLGRLRDLVRGGELQLEELGLPINALPPGASRIFDGIRIVGAPGDRLGQAQDRAGDFNNDGIADVVIGSPLVNGRRGGAAVFFGSRDVINLTEREIAFAEIPERGLGVIFVGEDEGDLAGARVAGVGDIDGDGNDDILIAAPNRSVRLDIDLDGQIEIDRQNCGVVYLVYGSPNLQGTLSLADIGTERLPGAVFIGRNSGDFLGAGLGEEGDRSFGIAGARDVDGDGRNDLLLSAIRASPRNRAAAGEAYLIYGAGD